MDKAKPGTSTEDDQDNTQETTPSVTNYYCDLCDKVCKSKSGITRHRLTHDPNAKVRRSKRSVKKLFPLNGEEDTVTLDDYDNYLGNFTCDVCGRKFITELTLKVHLFTHTDDRFVCEECGKLFNQKSDLKRHSLTVHCGERNFKCEECGKRFTRRSHLNTHTLIHTGEKNYDCMYCGKAFTQKSVLKTHVLTIHLGVGKFECVECGKKFTQEGHLKVHTLSHSDERNFECEECGKKFTLRGNLNRHILCHTKRLRKDSPPANIESSEEDQKPTVSSQESADGIYEGIDQGNYMEAE